MTSSTPTLISLLHLLDGRLPADAAEQLRLELQADTALRSRWEQLLDAIDGASTAEGRGEPGEPEPGEPEPAVSAEDLAAFVEQSLPLADAERVERLLWKDARLLREAHHILRYCQTPNGVPTVSSALRSRLLQLWPSMEADELPPAMPAVSTSETSIRRLQQRRRRRTSLWLWIGAAAAAAAVIIAGVLQSVSPSPNHEGLARPDAPQSPRAETTANPDQAVQPRRRSLPDDAPDEPPSELGPLPSIPRPTVAENHRPVSPSPVPARMPDPLDDPQPERYLPQEATPIVLSWKRVLGLVAAVDHRRDRWLGVNAPQLDELDAYVAMTKSWAESERESWGQLTLAEDSMVAVTKPAAKATTHPLDVHLHLRFGRLGVREIPQGTRIRVSSDWGHTDLMVAEDRTTIAALAQANTTQLMVIEGQVRMGGETLSRGSARRWQNNRWERMAVSEATSKWITSPVDAVRLTKGQQEKLLVSDDLRRDLRELQSRVAPGSAKLMIQWQFALSPRQSVIAALRSRDVRERSVAVEWLIARPPTDPLARQVYRRLADEIGDPQAVRQLAQGIQYVRHTGHMPMDLAQHLVRLLNHSEPAVRTLSHGLLASMIKVPSSFDPYARPEARVRAVAIWSQLVKRYYAARTNRPNRAKPRRN